MLKTEHRRKHKMADTPNKTATDKYRKILKEYWGYDDFRGIQRDIIDSITAGKDTLGLMPTGGGKSITFQVPALSMKGVCIVITPLIALMKDQVEHLRKKGVKAYAIYGSMQRNEILRILENAVLGGATLLYISPERLSSELFLSKLQHMDVSFFTIDEAHCICQWGYDFRPSYLAISKIRQLKPEAPILALTATAPPSYIKDIQKQLGFKEENVFRMSFMRKNIAYIVREAVDKEEQMLHILRAVGGCAIVYTYSRRKTKDISKFLNDNGISATYYHAGLEHTERDKRQQTWQEDKVKVMVATNAFGMGIDKPDVRLVIHFDCPDSIESYYQEAGRAGRDGEKAYAVLLYNSKDHINLMRGVLDKFPDKDYIKLVYEDLAYFFQIAVGSAYNRTFEFDIDKFCRYFKHFPTRVVSALQILEKAGYIEYSENGDNRAQLHFLIGRNDLYRFDEMTDKENAVIIAALRNYSGLFSDYVYVNEALIASQSGLTESETYEILKGLSKKRILHFIPRKDIPRIRYTQSRVDMDEISIPKDIYELRKEQYTRRVKAMLTYAENDVICRSQELLSHLGEPHSKRCGTCDICVDQKKRTKEDKETDKRLRLDILKMLEDKKPHCVKELYNLNYELKRIDRVLRRMADEEEIFNADGKITR